MSTYIKLSTLEYPRHIGDIQIDPAGMADYAPVEWADPPTINPERQRCHIGPPVQQAGVWKTNWVIEQIPDSEQAAKVRADRNQRLAACDWTQLADVPVDRQPWAAYRQGLRDITAQQGFPWTVVWPAAPST
jgi:hypothetical protein